MPINNFDRYEDKELWCVINNDDHDEEILEYFLTEVAAKNWCKKQKINLKDVTIFSEYH